jgi:GDPmannose 4,6-dehydratase
MAITDFRSVLQILTETSPDELYNLSGQSSVALSFMLPVETLESIIIGTLNLLEAVRIAKKTTRIFNTATSECFGNTLSQNASTETSPFRPRSPYGVAKAASFWEVANYREAYDLFACTGILFNHESSLRPARFVTRKVVQAATAIANRRHLASVLRQRRKTRILTPVWESSGESRLSTSRLSRGCQI